MRKEGQQNRVWSWMLGGCRKPLRGQKGTMTVSSDLQSRPRWLLRKRKRVRPAFIPTTHSHPFPLTGAYLRPLVINNFQDVAYQLGVSDKTPCQESEAHSGDSFTIPVGNYKGLFCGRTCLAPEFGARPRRWERCSAGGWGSWTHTEGKGLSVPSIKSWQKHTTPCPEHLQSTLAYIFSFVLTKSCSFLQRNGYKESESGY